MISRQSIPNWLTYARLAVVPVVLGTFYLPGFLGMHLTAALFGLACITDWFDGYLARKWHVQSNVGRFLDPIADKLLVATCLLLLVGQADSALITVPAVVIICREILVSGLREFLAEIQVTVHVTRLAKYKTASQMVAVFLLLWSDAAFAWLDADFFGTVLLWVSALLTLITGYEYVIAGWKYMQQPPAADRNPE